MLHDNLDFKFTVRLSSRSYIELAEAAESLGISTGDLIRRLIDAFLLDPDFYRNED